CAHARRPAVAPEITGMAGHPGRSTRRSVGARRQRVCEPAGPAARRYGRAARAVPAPGNVRRAHHAECRLRRPIADPAAHEALSTPATTTYVRAPGEWRRG